jgi:DNA-binding transcriptional regulator YhcF (GntR family)
MNTQQEQVARSLITAISGGSYPEGSWLPTADEIARKHKCSSHAVSRAFRHLSDRGILRSVKRKGTQVVRRPALGKVLFMNSWEAHTNLLLQEAISHALINHDFEVEFIPYIFHNGTGFEKLRLLSSKDADSTVLVTLAQEAVPAGIRPDWERFAAGFLYRVGFQFEDMRHLPDSTTILPDPLVEARLVAEHLLSLGHRRIGVMAGNFPSDGTLAERRAAVLGEMLSMSGAECFPYYYNRDSREGVPAFVKRNRCTAWWTINDHQAVDHIFLLQQAGMRIPDDVSVVGSNDTPWATGGALPLTTISLNPEGIAQAIADAVLGHLARPVSDSPSDSAETGHGCRKSFVRPTLVVRNSTVPVSGS